MELSVLTRQEGPRTVVAVTGEIDVYTAPSLREQLNELVSGGHYQLVVDMAGVDFLDSTGLGVLVGSLKRARSHDGSLRLVCDQEKILKVFRITGLTKVFPIHSTLAEALAAPDDDVAGQDALATGAPAAGASGADTVVDVTRSPGATDVDLSDTAQDGVSGAPPAGPRPR